MFAWTSLAQSNWTETSKLKFQSWQKAKRFFLFLKQVTLFAFWCRQLFFCSEGGKKVKTCTKKRTTCSRLLLIEPVHVICILSFTQSKEKFRPTQFNQRKTKKWSTIVCGWNLPFSRRANLQKEGREKSFCVTCVYFACWDQSFPQPEQSDVFHGRKTSVCWYHSRAEDHRIVNSNWRTKSSFLVWLNIQSKLAFVFSINNSFWFYII